jgi:pantoate--beta-alanine ligase
MEVLKTQEEVKNYIRTCRKASKSIGFVPTMGALHEGHISLFNLSKKENDITIGSIFVNPIQFNDPGDFSSYPIETEKDISILKSIGCEAIFMPDTQSMYQEQPKLSINFGSMELIMEGKFRPGHFNGVAIVVAKLFNIVNPDKAYFGQKDLQQYLIIKRMVQDLSFPIQLTCCPTMREKDGLAMSSRNVRISNTNRPVAAKLYEALLQTEKLIQKVGVEKAKKEILSFLNQYPAIKVEYFETVDGDTLMPLKDTSSHTKIAVCIAAYIDGVRLIDNILINA